MLILLPVGVDYRAQRYPVVTFTLMGINIAVYLISLACFFANGEEADRWILEHLWLTPAKSVWYTYLTALFVHGGFFHLLGNMIYLFLFGSCVEDTLGRLWFVVFYLVGGLISDFAHIAASPEHFAATVPLGGASGAISACIGGFLLLFLKTKINFKYFCFFFFRFWSGDFWLPAWLVISFWFLKDLASAILTAMAETSGGGVAFAAHIGGMLAGLAMIGTYKSLPAGKAKLEEAGSLEPLPSPVRVNLQHQPPSIYLWDGAAESGPFTALQVQQMLSLGSIGTDAYFWKEGFPDWRSLSEFNDSV